MGGQRMIRILAVGLVLAVVSLVGASPVLAQDGSEPAAESSGRGTDADELLSKVVERVSSVYEGSAPHPMMRVESDLLIEYDGNTQWDMPDFNWEFVSSLDSTGDSNTFVTLSADGWEPNNDRERLAVDFLNNFHMRTVIGDTAYYPVELESKILESFGFIGGDACVDFFGSWVAVEQPAKEDRSQNQQQVLQKILDGRLEFESLYYLVPMGDDLLNELLVNSESPEIVEQDVVNGYDVSRMRLNISSGLLAFVFVPYLEIMITSLATMGYNITRSVPLDLLEVFFDTTPNHSYDIWADGDGRIHRLYADISVALGGYLSEFFADVGFVSDALVNTFTAEVEYIEENPAIEQLPDDQVIVASSGTLGPADITEEQHFQCVMKIAQFEELPSTGVNTLLLAIIGLSAIAAGLMVFGLSRRLRNSASL